VLALNKAYPGGLACYASRARKLLQASATNVNPYEGLTPSVPVGYVVDFKCKDLVELEAQGLQTLGETAFVLVAGGLGERLGYNGIKIELPVELMTGCCFL
jgi:UDP-sugar pyrophosphorylase